MRELPDGDFDGRDSAYTRRQSLSALGSLLTTCSSISSALSSYCEPQVSYPAPRGSPRRSRHGSAAEPTAIDGRDSTLRVKQRLNRKRSHSDGALLTAFGSSKTLGPMHQEHIVTGAFEIDDFGAPSRLSRWQSSSTLGTSPGSVASDVSSVRSVAFSDTETGYASSDSFVRPSRMDIPTRSSCIAPSPLLVLSAPHRELPRQKMGSYTSAYLLQRESTFISPPTGLPHLSRPQPFISGSVSPHQLLSPHLRAHSHPTSRSPSPCPSLSSSSDFSATSSAIQTPLTEDLPSFPGLIRSESQMSFKPSSPRRSRTTTGGSTTRVSRRGSEAELAVPGGRKTFLGDFGVYVEEDEGLDDASFFNDVAGFPAQLVDEPLGELSAPTELVEPDARDGAWLPRMAASFGLTSAWRLFVPRNGVTGSRRDEPVTARWGLEDSSVDAATVKAR